MIQYGRPNSWSNEYTYSQVHGTIFPQFQKLWRAPRPSFAAFLQEVHGPRFPPLFLSEFL